MVSAGRISRGERRIRRRRWLRKKIATSGSVSGARTDLDGVIFLALASDLSALRVALRPFASRYASTDGTRSAAFAVATGVTACMVVDAESRAPQSEGRAGSHDWREMESRLSSFRISGGPVVRRGIDQSRRWKQYGLVWPSLGNSEASAGLCTLTPFRSSLDHEPCVGRGGIDQETGEIFPARRSGRLFLASHEPPRLSRHRKALFDATVSGCERFIETCGYLDRCHNTRRTSACARREGLSRAPPIPTTPTHLTTSS